LLSIQAKQLPQVILKFWRSFVTTAEHNLTAVNSIILDNCIAETMLPISSNTLH